MTIPMTLPMLQQRKRELIKRRDSLTYSVYYNKAETIYLYDVETSYGVTVAWTKVEGPDAGRVTLNGDGTATLNSVPAFGEADGSITMTETVTKGDATDTVVYTFVLKGKADEGVHAYGYIPTNFITMSADGVTPEAGDYWYLEILYWADEARRDLNMPG